MSQNMKRISLAIAPGMGSVNCYLLESENGYILIDTGISFKRKELVRSMESAGCKPGQLQLILLTHGDFDHTGNAAYLREGFGAKIAMHIGDAGMGELGDMFFNRKAPNALIRWMVPFFTGFGKRERFKPDLFVEDGFSLEPYGFQGSVVSLPGHSQGSVGVVTVDGSLFCGDLFENTKTPTLNSLMDDPLAGKASMDKLTSMQIQMVHPGHGEPFLYNVLL